MSRGAVVLFWTLIVFASYTFFDLHILDFKPLYTALSSQELITDIHSVERVTNLNEYSLFYTHGFFYLGTSIHL